MGSENNFYRIKQNINCFSRIIDPNPETKVRNFYGEFDYKVDKSVWRSHEPHHTSFSHTSLLYEFQREFHSFINNRTFYYLPRDMYWVVVSSDYFSFHGHNSVICNFWCVWRLHSWYLQCTDWAWLDSSIFRKL